MQGWLIGPNYTPATAINQLEMWQEDTSDPETIDKEPGWAADNESLSRPWEAVPGA